MTDGQLLERFLNHKSREAFEELLQRHSQMVFGVCQRILMNHHDAEEAFQATFLVLAHKAKSCLGSHTLAGWLHEVAQRTALNSMRTRTKRQVREQQVKEMPERIAQKTGVWSELVPLLDQELSRLPEKYRVAIVLCDLEGHSQKDAARVLGCPEGTLSSRLTRAREMLRTRIVRHGAEVSTGVLVAAITQQAASANVPAELLSSTVQSVQVLITTTAVITGTVSPQVTALTEGVLKTMFYAQVKSFAVVAMVILATGLGTGAVYQVALAQVKADAKSIAIKNEQVLQKLQGEWRVIDFETQGTKIDDKDLQMMKLVYSFSEKKVVVKGAKGKHWEGTMNIDTSKSPWEVDMHGVIKESGHKEPDSLGVFQFDGETLKIHVAVKREGKDAKGNGVKRPTDLTKTIATPLRDDDALLTMQRVQP